MNEMGKIMIVAGIAIALIGGVFWIAGRAGFRGLPGDVRYDSGDAHFYFPVVTCIVVSLLMTLGFWFWKWMSRR